MGIGQNTLAVPRDNVVGLQYEGGGLHFCGLGSAPQSLSFLDGATGEVICCFVGRLIGGNRIWAYVKPLNDELAQGAKRPWVFVEWSNLPEGTILWLDDLVLLGPITEDEEGFLIAPTAWNIPIAQ